MSRDNIVYIGRKPAMSYVMAVLATFNNQDTVEIKARGRSITTAVDVAEITRNRYVDGLAKPRITIKTEKLSDGDSTRNVSCMTIKLSKTGAAKEPAEKAAPPKAEPVAKPKAEPKVMPKPEPKPAPEPKSAPEAKPSEPVTEIKGVGKATEEKLVGGGYDTVAKVAGADAAKLAEKTNLSEKQAEKLIEAAKDR